MSSSQRFSVQGKVVLITGASSGFGAHFARVLASEGAKVGLAARRVDALESIAATFGRQVERLRSPSSMCPTAHRFAKPCKPSSKRSVASTCS